MEPGLVLKTSVPTFAAGIPSGSRARLPTAMASSAGPCLLLRTSQALPQPAHLRDVRLLSRSFSRPAALRRPATSVTFQPLRVTNEAIKLPMVTPKRAVVYALPFLLTPWVGSVMAPYLLGLALDAPNAPPLVGVELIDKTVLAIYGPIFRDFLSIPAGAVTVVAFISMCFTWYTAAGIESSRASSKGIFTQENPAFVYTVAIFVAIYLFLPCLWVADYVCNNEKIPETKEEATEKAITPKSVAAVQTAMWSTIFSSPLYFMSLPGSLPFGCTVLQSLFSPIVNQALWSPFKGQAKGAEAKNGHIAALVAHLLCAGAGMLAQATLIAMICNHPEALQQLRDLVFNQEGSLHGPYFMLVDITVMYITFGFLPLFEAGSQAALLYYLSGPVLGPGTSLGLYFAWREWQLLQLAEASDK